MSETEPTRVMVVDDHPLWRDAVGRDLAAAGFDVVAVAALVIARHGVLASAAVGRRQLSCNGCMGNSKGTPPASRFAARTGTTRSCRRSQPSRPSIRTTSAEHKRGVQALFRQPLLLLFRGRGGGRLVTAILPLPRALDLSAWNAAILRTRVP